MITNLPQWYRIAAIDNISEDTLEKRSLAITEILESSDEAFYFNCIRLYLGKKISEREFDDQFFTAFNAKDGLYLNDTPLLEKKILAGAIISQWFGEDNEFADQVAYALVCGSFGIADTDLINKDIIVNAQNYLNKKAEVQRTSPPVAIKTPTWKDETPTAETMGTYVKSVATYVKNMTAYTEKQIKNSQKRIDRLQEESDIHWWLFRAFSNLKGVPVSELEPTTAAFILAYELSKLITILPAPSNITSFLNKVLKGVADLPSTYTLQLTAETVSNLNGEFADVLSNDKYGNLTPLAFAVGQIAETSGDDAWIALFKLSAKVDVNQTFSTQDIALQLFNELMLLSI